MAAVTGTQRSADEEKRSTGTSRTTPTTRKRWPSASIVLPTAGCRPKKRSRVVSLITATKRPAWSSATVYGPPSMKSKSSTRQNSASARRNADWILRSFR